MIEVDQDGRLPENIAYFARILRRAGLKIGPGAVVEAVDALTVVGLGAREDFYWTLHALFVKRREDSEIYDQAFRLFWRKRALVEKMMALMTPIAPGGREPEKKRPGGARVAEALQGEPRRQEKERSLVDLDARFTASDREILQKKDFAQMTAAELAQARRLVKSLVLPLDAVRTRRLRPDPRGAAIDPRRTLRASLRSGGDLIDLKRRAPIVRRPPVVALLDISGSMSDYARIVLHFLHALGETRRVSSFLFGTRLTNVTRHLRARDPDEALARCSEAAADWSGGTRIGSSLHSFNRDWSRRVLGQGPVVLIVTDGLERDPDADLAKEMERLRKSCRRLVWLNPLLRFEGFEAKAGGVRAMLPHVDEFRPVHNLESMASLARALGGRRGDGRDARSWLAAA